MQSPWPLFPVTSVGSWPRPPALARALSRGTEDRAALADAAVIDCIRAQEEVGVDILVDGEQRRDNFYSFITDHLDGIRLMTMADLLDYVEDKAAFENLLEALDVPAFAIKNPTIVGPLWVRTPLGQGDLAFLRAHTSKPVKVTLPGPYLLCRSTWVKGLSAEAYPDRDALAEAIVEILRDEALALAAQGASIIQFDEPVLTELAFAGKSETRTFMCAALAASAAPDEELAFAVDLMNRVVEGVRGAILAVHICRGNWSTDEEVLLEGSYDKLIPHITGMKVDQFVLEYATPRAGTIGALRDLPPHAQLGFGVVNPRTTEIEDPEAIARRVGEVAELLGAERIFLNPDCGFGTFAERPMASAEIARDKLATLVAAARLLRG